MKNEVGQSSTQPIENKSVPAMSRGRKALKVLVVGSAVLCTAVLAHATDTALADTAAAEDAVGAAITGATAKYLLGAGLGIAIMTVGWMRYAASRGVKLK